MDHFSLVEAVDRFGGGIVITVADTFDIRRQLLPAAQSTGRTDIGRRLSLQWAVEPPLTRQANACIRLSGPSRDKQTLCPNLIGLQNLAIIPLQSHHLLGHFAFS